MIDDCQFVECDACRAKPGSPVLCQSCLANRNAIDVLRARYDELRAGLCSVLCDNLDSPGALVRAVTWFCSIPAGPTPCWKQNPLPGPRRRRV